MRQCLLALFLLLAFAAQAQPSAGVDRTPEALYDQLNAFQVQRYRPDSGYTVLRLPSTFSGPELAALNLRGQQLVRIDLIYTSFRTDPRFDQRQLNLERLRNLNARLPGVLQNEAITWNLIEQIGCNSAEQCEGFYHGFALYIEKRYTRAESRAEIARLTARLDDAEKKIERVRAMRKLPGVPLSCSYPQVEHKLRKTARRVRRGYRCADKAEQLVAFRAEVNDKGQVQTVELLPDTARPAPPCAAELTSALRQELVFTSGFPIGKLRFPFVATGRLALPLRRDALKFSGFYLADSIVRKHRIKFNRDGCQARLLRPGDPLEDDPIPPPSPSAVAKVLARHPEWRKQVVVADVTGSMYPYIADLLVWLQLGNQPEPRTFVFFNDGNDLPDEKKAIGRTGGLYEVSTAEPAQVRRKVVEAMMAGLGGDAPENDAEALLRAHALVPDAPELILVADNHTFPRDTRLLEGTKLPVKIILCGASDYINPRYLALARQYGYSLHTLEADITDLGQLPEGAAINVGAGRYEVTKTGFRRVSRP